MVNISLVGKNAYSLPSLIGMTVYCLRVFIKNRWLFFLLCPILPLT